MLSKEEIKKAKRICRLLCGKKRKKSKREYKTFTRMQMQIDYTVDQMAEGIETLLQYINQLEQKNKKLNKMIDEMANLLNSLKLSKDTEGYEIMKKEDWKQYFEKKVEEN